MALPSLSWKIYLLSRLAIIICTSVALIQIAVMFLLHPFRFLERIRGSKPPDCLLDATLGKHEYVRANGINFHYVTRGDPSKPLMLFLHGFPEFWYSWRHQMREFCDDYHTVAVDLRGYGKTDKPPNIDAYFITNLVKDVVELIPALGHEKAFLVAHDWGAAIAWIVTQYHSQVVDKLVILNGPHPLVMATKKLSLMQVIMSWYMLFFQVLCLPEFFMSACNYGNLDVIFRGKLLGVRNKKYFTSEDVRAYRHVFSQDGALTPPINYYRANVLRFEDYLTGNPGGVIDVPTLIIWGDDDGFLNAGLADAHGGLVSDVRVRHIEKCSHWAQNDEPDRVNQHIREFLA